VNFGDFLCAIYFQNYNNLTFPYLEKIAVNTDRNLALTYICEENYVCDIKERMQIFVQTLLDLWT
jgi:hypothetical protein